MADYNATGAVRTLVGNWQEEAVLKASTGTARCKVPQSVLAQSVWLHLQLRVCVCVQHSNIHLDCFHTKQVSARAAGQCRRH